MTDAPTDLNAWLGRCYVADMKRELGVVIPEFRTWIGTDPQNKATAQAKVQTDQSVLKRDHISRAYNSYLSQALNGGENG